MRSRFSFFVVSQILTLVFFASSCSRAAALSVGTPSSDYSDLVYNNCSAYKSSSPGSLYTDNINAFFREVIAKSSELKFYKTTVGSSDGQFNGISGLFQCRGDLSSSECNGCITKLPDISSNTLCAAARIQLSGCYVCYGTEGFNDDDDDKWKKKLDELVYSNCSDKKGPEDDYLFKKARDDAFSDAQKGLKDGCYVGSVDDKVRVIAQCEGDLGECNCAECIYAAVQYAGDKCGNSIKGEIYLNKCFLRYSYKTPPHHPKPPHDDGPVPPGID